MLLDTHTLIWLVVQSEKLGARALELINEAWKSDSVYVSSITFWEIALLEKRGRIRVLPNLLLSCRELLAQGLNELPVDSQIAIQSVNLDDLPRDPADRIIVATALGKYRLVTADQGILSWPGRLDRIDASV